MLEKIDNFLNRITMYRLVLYYLIFLLAVAGIFGSIGVMPYNLVSILFSSLVLVAVCWFANTIFAKFLNVQTNSESVYITALILALIITPVQHNAYSAYMDKLPLLIWAGVLAMASKYIINIGNKHIFNPAAISVAITALVLNQSASWWIGNTPMFIFTLIGGLLVIRKVRRFDAVIAFALAALATILILTAGHLNSLDVIRRVFLESPLVFFAAIMLTEPLTMPPTRNGRITYGLLVGVLFSPQSHIGSFYFTPELALLIGNILSYAISPKRRHMLKLIDRQEIGKDIYNFTFKTDKVFKFKAGQYMEWTLGHKKTDNRGNRRFFTIASSPTEQEIHLGVKFYDHPSSFKKKMLNMQLGENIVAAQLAGDFVLPRNQNEKLVFIAGGIGITPFRSMLKYLLDNNEKRSIIMFYSNRTEDEIVYEDVLYDAWKKLGISILCTLTDKTPQDWTGYKGYITPEMIMREVPDYKQRIFYISGSHVMVSSFKKSLAELGIPRRKIKTDFFPGLA